MTTIAELAKRHSELEAELAAVREEIASRHGQTAEADLSTVETATAPRPTRRRK